MTETSETEVGWMYVSGWYGWCGWSGMYVGWGHEVWGCVDGGVGGHDSITCPHPPMPRSRILHITVNSRPPLPHSSRARPTPLTWTESILKGFTYVKRTRTRRMTVPLSQTWRQPRQQASRLPPVSCTSLQIPETQTLRTLRGTDGEHMPNNLFHPELGGQFDGRLAPTSKVRESELVLPPGSMHCLHLSRVAASSIGGVPYEAECCPYASQS